MDELLILGCIVLFFALVVVPILAIVALNRSASVRFELAVLRRRVEQLEQQRAGEAPAVQVTAEPSLSAKERVAPSLPDAIEAAIPEPENPWAAQETLAKPLQIGRAHV